MFSVIAIVRHPLLYHRLEFANCSIWTYGDVFVFSAVRNHSVLYQQLEFDNCSTTRSREIWLETFAVVLFIIAIVVHHMLYQRLEFSLVPSMKFNLLLLPPGHKDAVLALALTPDEHYLISGSQDATIKVT